MSKCRIVVALAVMALFFVARDVMGGVDQPWNDIESGHYIGGGRSGNFFAGAVIGGAAGFIFGLAKGLREGPCAAVGSLIGGVVLLMFG